MLTLLGLLSVPIASHRISEWPKIFLSLWYSQLRWSCSKLWRENLKDLHVYGQLNSHVFTLRSRQIFTLIPQCESKWDQMRESIVFLCHLKSNRGKHSTWDTCSSDNGLRKHLPLLSSVSTKVSLMWQIILSKWLTNFKKWNLVLLVFYYNSIYIYH